MIKLRHNGSTSSFKVFAIKQHETAFSYLEIQESSCIENISLNINVRHEHNSYHVHVHQFLVDRKIEWTSTHGNLDFDIHIPHNSNVCEMTILHQSYDYQFCVREWYNITPFCYKFWRSHDWYGLANPLCNEYRCYTILHGGQLSWNLAQNMCEDINSSLIAVNSHEEMDFARMMIYPFMPVVTEKTFLSGESPGSKVCFSFHGKHFITSYQLPLI